MNPSIGLLVGATLFTIMFALGLSLEGNTLGLLHRRPALMARVLIGSCVLVPLAALLLLQVPWSEGLSQPSRFAIGLMALSPSAPLILRKAGKQGGNRQLAAMLQATAAVAAIVSIPLMADLYGAVFRVGGWNITPAMVARQVGQAQVLPLLAGLLLRRSLPRWAARLQGPLDRIANGLLLLLIVAVLLKTGHLLVPFVAANGLAVLFMAVVVLASLAIGSLLAGASSDERISEERITEERITVALVTSMRNPGLALLFATTYGAGMEGLKLAILAYLLVTVLVSVPFLRWQRSLRLSMVSGSGPGSDSGARQTGGDNRRRSDRH